MTLGSLKLGSGIDKEGVKEAELFLGPEGRPLRPTGFFLEDFFTNCVAKAGLEKAKSHLLLPLGIKSKTFAGEKGS